MCNKVLITAMSKPENVLIIDPAQELKFRGKFGDEKAFVKKRVSCAKKPTKSSQKCAIYALLA